MTTVNHDSIEPLEHSTIISVSNDSSQPFQDSFPTKDHIRIKTQKAMESTVTEAGPLDRQLIVFRLGIRLIILF